MKKSIFIGSLLSASLLAACSGNTGENANPSKGGDSITTNSQAKPQNSCWKSSVSLMGFEAKVTPNGGVKIVFTNWNETMDVVTNVLAVKYPYDAPFKEEEVKGLLGKVTGLCVAGNPMSPSLYFQLQDGKVQMLSVEKLLTKWFFWAGRPITDQPVKEIKEVTEDFMFVVAELQNGKIVKDDDFVTPMLSLSSYYKNFIQPGENKYCNLFCDLDGSLTYIEYGPNLVEKAVYHGYISSVDEKKSGNTYNYVLTNRNVDGKDIAMNSKGQFREESIVDDFNHTRFTPISGLNIFSMTGEKIGELRDVCNGTNKWE